MLAFNKKWTQWLVAYLCWFFMASAGAQSPSTQPQFTSQADDHWHWTVAPYLWAMNMNGSAQIKGQRASVHQTFGDILKDLNWAGMVWLEADKGKLGIFLNLLYASLSQGASDRYISAHVNSSFGLYSAGLSYEVYKTCLCSGGCQPGDSTLKIVPYIGARYTSNDASLTVNSILGSVRGSDNQHWTDPFIGARLNFDLSRAWLLSLAADVGGTNASSDHSYNVWGLIGYRPQALLKATAWYLGYRVLDQLYIKGGSSNYYYWNMKMYGPVAGVSVTL